MDYRYIDTDKALKQYIQQLNEEKISTLAVDIEGEYNLHCYGEHLCLVQIYDQKDFVLIDPLKVDMNLVKALLEDPKILKIFYDCTGDRTLLYRKYSIDVKGIFDLMPAVELLEFPKRNLNYILHDVLNLDLKPKKKFQQYNWMKRPIQEEALVYAVEDVQFLFELKDKLSELLLSKNLMDEFKLKNTEVQTRNILKEGIPGAFKKPRFRKMSRDKQETFKALFHRREETAKNLNWPANSVVSNDNLFRLVQNDLALNNLRFSPRIKRDTKEGILKDFSALLE